MAEFEFLDIRYLPRSLADFPAGEAFVLFFSTTTCPLVQRYYPKVDLLAQAYRDRGIRFLSVNVGPEDDIAEMATQVIEQEVTVEVVKDHRGEVASAVGIDRSCGVVLLDGKRRLRYRGRIDRQFRYSGVSPQTGREDLKEAIEDFLAGREVSVSETPYEGCKITSPGRPELAHPVTYSADVAPLIADHCQVCHHPNGQAPFGLQTYDDVADRAEMIAEVVSQRRMPPWFGSRSHGNFANQRGLTARQRQTILDWVRTGTPEGDPKDLPPPLEFEDVGWSIGEPDLVLQMPVEQKIPATGYVPYRYVIFPYRFKHDTWIESIQIKPSNPRVVHHANLAYVSPGETFRQENLITGIVPGGDAMKLGSGVAAFVPKGAVLALQCHYVTTGKKEKDRTSIGFRFPREPVQKKLNLLMGINNRFAIPPGAHAHEVTASRTFPVDAIGLGLFSHMHLRGKDMAFRVTRPGGEAETLLIIPNYSFDWQMSYRWEGGTVRFPKGTRFDVTAHFDNTAFNPFNPDPTETVRFGPQTYHEMMYGFLFYVAEAEALNILVDPATGVQIQ